MIEKLSKLSLWKRLALAFAAGSLMVLSMPPFNLFPILWICFPIFIILLEIAKNLKQAFFTGWFFALGFFIFGLFWISAALFVDIEKFWWAVPLSLTGLPAFFAVYYGFAGVIAKDIAKHKGLLNLQGALLVGALWCLGDIARSYLFTGFSWNLLGYTWSVSLSMLQITSVIGIYGLTLITGISASLPVCLFSKNKKTIPLIGIAVLVVLAVYGVLRLENNKSEESSIFVRVVQPNIKQTLKWDKNESERNFQTLIELSAMDSEKKPDYIILPETASAFYLVQNPMKRLELAQYIPFETVIVAGTVRIGWDENHKAKFYNSIAAIDSKGYIQGLYDKSHLVPFGEYIPYRKYLPLQTIAGTGEDFTKGSGIKTLEITSLPSFSPLICYEAIFPGRVTDPENRPDFLINATNDAWYGRTTGPYQHFAIVRVRAIEEGLPLVRAANTGISAVIDGYGRIIEKTNIFEKAVIDRPLPLKTESTFFARQHNLVFVMILIIISFIAIMVKIKNCNKKIK
ncbi:MAG: apolipoprotein N-acyltransferase [Alphaproteobacteria bacterium]|nr:apolipoprotein N-acyltransferase [Alphaproteobacteria bacterium]